MSEISKYEAQKKKLDGLCEERGVVGKYNGSEPREVLPADLPED